MREICDPGLTLRPDWCGLSQADTATWIVAAIAFGLILWMVAWTLDAEKSR